LPPLLDVLVSYNPPISTVQFLGTTSVTAEIYGRSEKLFDSDNTPVEALVSYGHSVGSLSFKAGVGAGLIDGYGASSWRIFTGLRIGI